MTTPIRLTRLVLRSAGLIGVMLWAPFAAVHGAAADGPAADGPAAHGPAAHGPAEMRGAEPVPPALFAAPFVPQARRVVRVNAGDNLQTFLDRAQLGDTLVLQAGATFTGPFKLPNKTSGTGWIYVQSSALARLPAAGRRVTPAHAADMPKLVVRAGAGAVLSTVPNAHHFRFVGIEMRPAPNAFVYTLVQIGGSQTTSPATLPNNIVFDRCYFHGDPSLGGRRGIEMDGVRIAVLHSYVSDFKEVGADSQALWAHNTTGPIKIIGNYLEAAGENVLFGGSDSQSPALVPSDIEIRQNHFVKPASWAR